MALITPLRDEGAADEILAVAEKHYEGALLALNHLTGRLDDDDITVADLQRAARDFRAATQTLFDERKRVEKHRKTDAGIAFEYGLDFDVARDQVRSILDCLRAT
jgi:hypothetical protein